MANRIFLSVKRMMMMPNTSMKFQSVLASLMEKEIGFFWLIHC